MCSLTYRFTPLKTCPHLRPLFLFFLTTQAMTEYAALPAEETPTVDYTALRMAAADPGPTIGPAPGKVMHTYTHIVTHLPSSVNDTLFSLSLCTVSCRWGDRTRR
jgi:hypothetical protein